MAIAAPAGHAARRRSLEGFDMGKRTAVDAEGSLRVDVKSEVARRIIDAMKDCQEPWRKPWHGGSLLPVNPITGNAYKGVNRLLLSMSGRPTSEWMTYRQAAERGWQVRAGERGAMIVRLVEVGAAEAADLLADGDAASDSSGEQAKRFALRRYYVFNASQIDGMPQPAPREAQDFEPAAKAEELIESIKALTGLKVEHQGMHAFYSPQGDVVRLPPKELFESRYDYWATALHECAHSTMAPHRLNRAEAYAKRWGDEAYAMEELTAELASAIACAEAGVLGTHANGIGHASYLSSWIRVLERDPMAIFTAAKAAERVSDYMLALALERSAKAKHKEWIAEYDLAARR
jgi:antirestriction protein ArdC